MKAIILAAGYGKRMRPLTDNMHKTLLEIAGNTIISNILDSLLENDVRDIVVATGYRSEELVGFLDDNYGEKAELSYVHNDRYRDTNNIYTLALVFNAIEIDQDLLIIESDLILDPSILSLAIYSKHANVALVDKYRSGMDGTVVSVVNSVVTEVIPPHLQADTFDFSDKYKTLNIYKFSQDFCVHKFKKLLTYYAQTIDDNCYYELILGVLIYLQRDVIHAECVGDSKWAEVDDPNDLRIAEFTFNKEARKQILERSHGGFWNYDILDFCFIRNMYYPPDSMLSEMRNNLINLVHNYGSSNLIVNGKLAYVLLCRPDRVVALNGAAQIYPFLEQKFANVRGLVPEPSFGEYSRIFDDYEQYPDTGSLDIDAIDRLSADKGVVVFVNPNNPTGAYIESGKIHDFARNHPDKMIVVDESFVDFAGDVSMTERLEQQPLLNVLVIKSLSKVCGIPGIRLGYVYCCDESLRNEIVGWLPIWNFNSLAEYTLEVMLKHRHAYEQSVARTVEDRGLFAEALKQLRAIDRVYDSSANFILVRLDGVEASTVVTGLLQDEGIYVKDISAKFPDDRDYIRLAVRTQEDNDRLVTALSKWVG